MVEEKLNAQHDNLAELLGEAHVDRVEDLMQILNILHRVKEAHYRRSFAKRGLYGIYSNLARKWDIIEEDIKDEFASVHTLDAAADLAVYAIKYLDTLAVLYPELFREWVEKTVTEIGINGASIEEYLEGWDLKTAE